MRKLNVSRKLITIEIYFSVNEIYAAPEHIVFFLFVFSIQDITKKKIIYKLHPIICIVRNINLYVHKLSVLLMDRQIYKFSDIVSIFFVLLSN